MTFNLKQALEFNKSTMALAAAGFGYMGKVAADSPELFLRLVGLAAVALFGVATIFGLLVIGRAAKLPENATDDDVIKRNGRWHSLALFGGLAIAAIFFVIGIIRGPEAKPAEAGTKKAAVVTAAQAAPA